MFKICINGKISTQRGPGGNIIYVTEILWETTVKAYQVAFCDHNLWPASKTSEDCASPQKNESVYLIKNNLKLQKLAGAG